MRFALVIFIVVFLAGLRTQAAELVYDGWQLIVAEDVWQPSLEPAAIPGKRWRRVDPATTLVMARRATTIPATATTAFQRREALELVMEQTVLDVLDQPAVVLTSRQDLFIEEMPAALLEWQLSAAEERWSQMALVVADQTRPGVVVAILSYDWQQRHEYRDAAQSLLLSLTSVASVDD